MKTSFFHFVSAVLMVFATPVWAGEEEFNQLQYKLETDVLELRQKAEEAYQTRCFSSTLQSCQNSNYDGCHSDFPKPVCPVGEDFSLEVCADDCSSKHDYSISTVSFPPRLGSRDDPAVIEDICYSKSLDSYFVEKYEADKSFWAGYGIDNPSMHFGTANGAFRIYPARVNETCNAYDPTVRPWYVAGSSGPKNVVLVMDTSGSMEGIRLFYLKQAATRIIDTLTVGDRVALVPFSTGARPEYFNGEALVKVTSSLKSELKKRINDLQAVGSTNIYDAFAKTFQVMEDSIPLELVVDCNTAILFLTDGKMTDPPGVTEASVLDFVEEGLARLQDKLDQPVYLFSYSVSENDDVHHFPKQLACSSTSNGIWSKVIDERTIVDSLSSYTNLFSLGLGEGRNELFTAWVEPYLFSTRGVPGVTVSAPVFDRTVSPPVLVGVVGLDLLVEALDRALDVEIGSSETYDRIVLSAKAKCPRLETSQCDMEGFRSFGVAGVEALCGVANCSNTNDSFLKTEICPNKGDLPTDPIHNMDLEDVSYVERVCCSPTEEGEFSPAFLTAMGDPNNGYYSACVTNSSAKTNTGAIIGGVVGGVVFLMLLAGLAFYYYKVRPNKRLPVATAAVVEETHPGDHQHVKTVAVSSPVNPDSEA